ncbi:hypothetical protein KFE98_09775 [bacterium SCSIO 12741]|nr:hypothetical protein KFE98_09775 [bacterium SCSIO 12741]
MIWTQIFRNSLYLIGIFLLIACQKEDEELFTLQYQVLQTGGNRATFSLNYLDPSNATVSTGILGPSSWESTEYKNVKAGIPIRMELKVESGSPKLRMTVLKNGSLVAEQVVSSDNSQNLISVRL